VKLTYPSDFDGRITKGDQEWHSFINAFHFYLKIEGVNQRKKRIDTSGLKLNIPLRGFDIAHPQSTER
jgi:hypothetical protein